MPKSLRRLLPSLSRKTSSRRRRELALIFALVFGGGGGAGLQPPAAATEIPFAAEQVVTTTGDFPRSVVAADLDGDGDLDLVSVSIADDKIAWQENVNGDGSVWGPESVIGTTADSPRGLFAADVDGDGDVDVLSASVADDKVAWYENVAGDGSAWTARTITTAADGVRSVFAADVDGDGDVDALSASTYDNVVAWYENTNGDGSAWTPRSISTNAAGVRSVFAADVDGDGDLDALAAATLGDATIWYENVNGDGSSWTTRVIATTADGPASVFAADVDGDGDVDALSASYYDDTIAWYENVGGSGTSWTPRTIATTADGALAVFAADMDGDGDVDALSASFGDDRIAWYENVGGAGSAWTARTISTSGDGSYAVFAADVDGDGDVDALSASGYDDKIAWYENETVHRGAVFPEQNLVSSASPGADSVRAVDIDGDGDLDALVAADGKIAWRQNTDGNGAFGSELLITSNVAYHDSIFAADIDGDGDLDVLSACTYYSSPGAYGAIVEWFENTDGAGAFGSAQNISSGGGDGNVSVVAGDVDGDGDLDVVAASGYLDKITWFENTDGEGSFGSEQLISLLVDDARSVFAADVDGDGDLDVLSASAGDDKVAWYENTDGQGSFAPQEVISTLGSFPRSVVASDVDGDGDLDVVAASSGDDEVAWYENIDGAGTFGPQQVISTLVAGSQSVEAADVDGDGDIDVLSASTGGVTIAWHENTDGQGAFSARQLITSLAFSPLSPVAADVDGDGDTDVLATRPLAWYPNRGGQFALPTTALAQGVVANDQEVVLLEIDLQHRGRAGDSAVELASIEVLLEDAAGLPLTSSGAEALIEELELYLDSGSGLFEPGSDPLLEQVTSFNLTSGVQTFVFTPGDANAQVAFGSSKRYFLVATMTSDADSQAPDSFEAFHLTETSSTGRDASTPSVPLLLEYAANVSTGAIDTDLTSASCTAPFELDLRGFTVSTTVVCEAGTELSVGGGLDVASPGDLTLRAGEQVRFDSDFSVQTGGKLKAEIDPALQPPP